MFFKCMFSPRLNKVLKTSEFYRPQFLENWSDKVVRVANWIVQNCWYFTPFMALVVCKYCTFALVDQGEWYHVMITGRIFIAIIVLRTIGRMTSPQYRGFVEDFYSSRDNMEEYLERIRKYDFEFSRWPVSFEMPATHRPSWIPSLKFSKCINTNLPLVSRFVIRVLAYISIHTFGIRIIYPGKMTFFQNMLAKPIIQGRVFLSEFYNGTRAKLRTADGNNIETMFIDFRPGSETSEVFKKTKRILKKMIRHKSKIDGDPAPEDLPPLDTSDDDDGEVDEDLLKYFLENKNKSYRYYKTTEQEPRRNDGNTLILCCEGNAGFYEIGIMIPVVGIGYSAIGWNHPGFGGSTGTPFPEQERNAVEAVMKYAIDVLGFTPNNIIVYGWSIGGYTASHIASLYPDLKAVILDATFDDILPLGLRQMPSFSRPWVVEAVRGYVDLRVGDLICQYDGPVKIIRRLKDDIICLRANDLPSNCTNMLCYHLIKHRHPELSESQLETVWALIQLPEHLRSTQFHDLKMLISHYMLDYLADHCSFLTDTLLGDVLGEVAGEKKIRKPDNSASVYMSPVPRDD